MIPKLYSDDDIKMWTKVLDKIRDEGENVLGVQYFNQSTVCVRWVEKILPSLVVRQGYADLICNRNSIFRLLPLIHFCPTACKYFDMRDLGAHAVGRKPSLPKVWDVKINFTSLSVKKNQKSGMDVVKAKTFEIIISTLSTSLHAQRASHIFSVRFLNSNQNFRLCTPEKFFHCFMIPLTGWCVRVMSVGIIWGYKANIPSSRRKFCEFQDRTCIFFTVKIDR